MSLQLQVKNMTTLIYLYTSTSIALIVPKSELAIKRRRRALAAVVVSHNN